MDTKHGYSPIFPPSDFKQLDRKIKRKKKGKGILS